MQTTAPLRELLTWYQRDEITGHYIYQRLAAAVKSRHNREVLERIAADELRHYHELKRYTSQDVQPNRWKVWRFFWISRIFGVTFGIKLLEQGEERDHAKYGLLPASIAEAQAIAQEEQEHEDELIALLDEERLRYVGSIVLGLSDALVELTGALAGLTLALRNTDLIALTGLITGTSAALSMGASEYLSTQTEAGERSPLTAALYTGAAYLVTVMLLILPYLVIGNYFVCLAIMLVAAVAIIALFGYYLAVARDAPFGRRFGEMSGLTLGVAVLSFLIGLGVRSALGVDV